MMNGLWTLGAHPVRHLYPLALNTIPRHGSAQVAVGAIQEQKRASKLVQTPPAQGAPELHHLPQGRHGLHQPRTYHSVLQFNLHYSHIYIRRVYIRHRSSRRNRCHQDYYSTCIHYCSSILYHLLRQHLVCIRP